MVHMNNLFAATAGLLLISPVSSNCFNDRNFSFRYAGMKRNCQNIRIDEFRRQEMCSRFAPVYEFCPQTCGRCCVDMPDYRFRTKRNSPIEVECSYVANNPERQAKYCKKWSAGMMVRDACPLSCDFCQPAVLQKPPSPAPVVVSPPPTPSPTKAPTPSPTAAPTKNPTKAPTKSPTNSPTKATPSPTVVCENDLNYFANNKEKLTCLYIGDNENLRQKWCKTKKTQEACPVTCGICCRDDLSWVFTTYQGTRKKCAWMKGEKIRQTRYCDKVRDGRLMKLACPETCNFCFDPVED